jgi:apolipoprotein N-acyltransferase
MKLFPDFETKKRFMKTGLPVILGIAWSPIIWMVVMAAVGKGLFALTGSWLFTQVVAVILVFVVLFLLLRIFMRIGSKFYSESR